MYADTTCSANDNLIRARFSKYKSSIYFLSCPFGLPDEIPEIPIDFKTFTIFFTDNIKCYQRIRVKNCDLEVFLITRED